MAKTKLNDFQVKLDEKTSLRAEYNVPSKTELGKDVINAIMISALEDNLRDAYRAIATAKIQTLAPSVIANQKTLENGVEFLKATGKEADIPAYKAHLESKGLVFELPTKFELTKEDLLTYFDATELFKERQKSNK